MYFWLVKAREHVNSKEKNNNGNLNHKTVCMKHFYDHQQDTQYNYWAHQAVIYVTFIAFVAIIRSILEL